METVYTAMRPLLQLLGDYRSLTLNVIQRLSSLVQLFPVAFNEKLCEQLQVKYTCFITILYYAMQGQSFFTKQGKVKIQEIENIHSMVSGT